MFLILVLILFSIVGDFNCFFRVLCIDLFWFILISVVCIFFIKGCFSGLSVVVLLNIVSMLLKEDWFIILMSELKVGLKLILVITGCKLRFNVLFIFLLRKWLILVLVKNCFIIRFLMVVLKFLKCVGIMLELYSFGIFLNSIWMVS